uniref:60S ribosomal protein L6 n=1 Tax=Tetraselmis sp. GSL018 TaxID=582737 RepID=A0A061RIH8_9CHLO|mmetsp:Transcript_21726/g.51928  ORF Transcript_21726/g.51928 Transcript_21726/m.51928 type:complete len:220 (-) Transcript_21726:58-717(-)
MAKEVGKGLNSEGRSKAYHRRGLWAIKKKNGGKFPTHPKKEKPAPAETKLLRFYPADDEKKPKPRRFVRRPTKLRASITPGTVLILLAGHFKGKRVVFLKQLESGLLLVTGPFNVNGVPLRRVDQSYVIATSTKLDVSAVDVSKFDDKYFKAEAKGKKEKSEEEFFSQEPTKKELPAEYIENQKAVDAAFAKILDEDMTAYLKNRFTLRDGMKPHLMKF